MLSNSKSILIIINTPPSLDLEASELALALAAFDLPVQVVFVGLGVHWLSVQQARKAQGKAAHKVLGAFALYGIENIYACTEDITEQALLAHSLPSFVRILSATQLAELMATSSHCLTL